MRILLRCITVGAFWGGMFPFLQAKEWQIGVGKADITGPAAEQGMMGYGLIAQVTGGIDTRLHARCFWLQDNESGKSLAIVVADLAMISDLIKGEVLKRLSLYDVKGLGDENLLLVATHTHSGPGGYMPYALYNVTTFGVSEKYVHTIVDGILRALQRAQKNQKPARLFFAQSALLESSINRNPVAFANNKETQQPTRDLILAQILQEKRNPFMSLLKMVEVQSETPIGTLNWFAVHPTSMSNHNRLISSDNKGLASIRLEAYFHTKNPNFVSGFANEAQGDVSPNYFIDPQRLLSDFKKTSIVADKQWKKALSLFATATEEILPQLDSRSAWVQMPGFLVDSAFTGTTDERLCQAALGLSFAAGAILDGPSEVAGFYEGMKRGDPFRWATLPALHMFLRPFVASPRQIACHGAKPILLTTGMAPYRWGSWTAEKLPFQLHRIGSLALIAAPAEISTMAGYRLRQQVGEILRPFGVEHVVLAGLANSYAGYVTTYEEYQTQYYGGAHTLYGPYTFAAYMQIFTQLALSMVGQGSQVPSVLPPVWELSHFLELRPGVIMDRPGTGHFFGEVLQQPEKTYHRGDTAKAVFVTGHPKNDYRTEDSFLVIQQWREGAWKSIYFDSADGTRYTWSRRSGAGCMQACSKSVVSWEIPPTASLGQYRIVHTGNYKRALRRTVFPLEGASESFMVVE